MLLSGCYVQSLVGTEEDEAVKKGRKGERELSGLGEITRQKCRLFAVGKE